MPALQPPEVQLSEDMKKVYEKELQEAQAIPLPDGDDEDL